MQIDLFGKKRWKVNLHMHTTCSDGRCTPEEALALYRAQGYDAVALTDHWRYGETHDADGLTVIGGAEYNTPFHDAAAGVYHILGIGCKRTPLVQPTLPVQQIIDAIHAVEGMAVLAHPAWSLNTPEDIMRHHGFDAIEIYNTVSGVHMSRRPDASLIVDMLATQGVYLPLIADDDTHYYDNDHCASWIMVEAECNSQAAILDAVRKKKFYATQGPEVHLYKEGDEYVVRCSPCREIVFLSNLVWTPNRAVTGNGLTEARYQPKNKEERYLRIEVTDENGKRAWTNILPIE